VQLYHILNLKVLKFHLNEFLEPYKKFKKGLKNMQLETSFLTFGITSFVTGLTFLIIYSCFGPEAKNLLDPFEEDND
jgi:hypothetical protein